MRAPAPPPDVRISDADRQRTIDQLSKHTGEGRLTLDEFEVRVDEVLEAKKHSQLQHALRELPQLRPPASRSHSRRPASAAFVQRFVGVLAILVGLAFLVGPWVLFLAIPLVCRAGRRHDRHRHENRHEELTRV